MPVFFTVMVKVKTSFTFAPAVGATEMVMAAFGINVPVNVGDGVKVTGGGWSDRVRYSRRRQRPGGCYGVGGSEI